MRVLHDYGWSKEGQKMKQTCRVALECRFCSQCPAGSAVLGPPSCFTVALPVAGRCIVAGTVARMSSRRGPTWLGPRYPLPKTENSSELAHHIFGLGQFIFYFLVHYKNVFYFPLRGPIASVPPPLRFPIAAIEAGLVSYGFLRVSVISVLLCYHCD